jgi:hypothetical protein
MERIQEPSWWDKNWEEMTDVERAEYKEWNTYRTHSAGGYDDQREGLLAEVRGLAARYPAFRMAIEIFRLGVEPEGDVLLTLAIVDPKLRDQLYERFLADYDEEDFARWCEWQAQRKA